MINSFVMPGLVPGIHALLRTSTVKTWMAGTSPAMTMLRMHERVVVNVERFDKRVQRKINGEG